MLAAKTNWVNRFEYTQAKLHKLTYSYEVLFWKALLWHVRRGYYLRTSPWTQNTKMSKTHVIIKVSFTLMNIYIRVYKDNWNKRHVKWLSLVQVILTFYSQRWIESRCCQTSSFSLAFTGVWELLVAVGHRLLTDYSFNKPHVKSMRLSVSPHSLLSVGELHVI